MDQVDTLKEQIAFMVKEKISLADAVMMFRVAYVRQAIENTVTANRPRGNICQAATSIKTHRNTVSRHVPKRATGGVAFARKKVA